MPKRTFTFVLLLATLLLGMKDGKMALWRLPDAEPLHVFSFRTAAFPKKIRSALVKGIRIEEDSDVGNLLLDMIE